MKTNIILIIAALSVLLAACKKETEKTYPTDGLVSWFNFDNNLDDQLGATPTGINNNSVTFTGGKAGKAITLNGSDQYISFARNTFRNGNNISVALWIKKSGTAGMYFILCDDFGIYTSEGKAGIAISTPLTSSAKGMITEGQWTHFVGTYDGTNIKAYINGVLTETISHTGNIAPWYGDMEIGRFNTVYWSGSVDDLFIYNKVLSQEEVTQLYEYHR